MKFNSWRINLILECFGEWLLCMADNGSIPGLILARKRFAACYSLFKTLLCILYISLKKTQHISDGINTVTDISLIISADNIGWPIYRSSIHHAPRGWIMRFTQKINGIHQLDIHQQIGCVGTIRASCMGGSSTPTLWGFIKCTSLAFFMTSGIKGQLICTVIYSNSYI